MLRTFQFILEKKFKQYRSIDCHEHLNTTKLYKSKIKIDANRQIFKSHTFTS